ncbi:MAG: aminodeoxychorismate/anthranilate synthase component II [Planctomycetaceae bacterium]|nr:aminodeoxychorismate/anthranilate synthase component II [Planctomycetaceae bacterium]
MILLIDNYDSFVYNLARYLTEMGQDTQVVRNDQISVADVLAREPEAIVLSPGPCTPKEAGISIELIAALPDDWPLLGVCLGHQAIAAAFGGEIVRAPLPVHGQTSDVFHEGTGLFQNLPNPMRATRYHSLILEEASLPVDLKITARTADNLPMALAHKQRPIYGVQFHPESVLTINGRQLLENFLNIAGLKIPQSSPAEFIAPPLSREGMITPAQANRPMHW